MTTDLLSKQGWSLIAFVVFGTSCSAEIGHQFPLNDTDSADGSALIDTTPTDNPSHDTTPETTNETSSDPYDPNNANDDPFKPRLVFAEGFTGGALPPGWISIDADGATPGPMWPYQGWEVVSQSMCMQCAPGCAISTSAYMPAAKADDWLITPPIELGDHTTAIWHGETQWGLVRDTYEVRISTDKPVIEDFLKNEPLFDMSPRHGEGWYGMHAHKVHLDLHGYQNQTVYLAIRNVTFNGTILCIGQFRVEEYEESSDAYDHIIVDLEDVQNKPPRTIEAPLNQQPSDTDSDADPSIYDNCDDTVHLQFQDEIHLTGSNFEGIYTDDHHWEEIIEEDTDGDTESDSEWDTGSVVQHGGCGYVKVGSPEAVFKVTIADGQKLIAKESGPLYQVIRLIDANGGSCDSVDATCLEHAHYSWQNEIQYDVPGTYYLVLESWFPDAHRSFDFHAGVYLNTDEETVCDDHFDDDGDGMVDCADADCSSTCGMVEIPGFPMEHFDLGIPEDWTITTYDRGHTWIWCDGSGFGLCFEWPHSWLKDVNLTGAEGGYALLEDWSESHFFGEYLDTPAINISGYDTLVLAFAPFYYPRVHPNGAYGLVRVSTDNENWRTVFLVSEPNPHGCDDNDQDGVCNRVDVCPCDNPNDADGNGVCDVLDTPDEFPYECWVKTEQDNDPWGPVQVDISNYVAGHDQMWVRFEYWDAGGFPFNSYSPMWQIDDVGVFVPGVVGP